MPICLGYFSVSFGVGLLAVRAGMSIVQAVILSLTNLTSAGQLAGIEVIAASGPLAELALTQFVINIRYALMGLSLSQRLAPSFTTPHRLLAAYGITDEVFGVCIGQREKLTPAYLYGMITVAVLGWTTGTGLGAAAGEILPASITAALGILLYAMFLAIILPPARDDRKVLCVVLIAIGLSFLVHYCLPQITSGFSVILCSVIASLIGALFFPIPEEEEQTGGAG